MSGIGRFKLTDALKGVQAGATDNSNAPAKGKSRAKGGKRGKAGATQELAAEQTREQQESREARNDEASIRARMVEIGRGNQQAGRGRTGAV